MGLRTRHFVAIAMAFAMLALYFSALNAAETLQSTTLTAKKTTATITLDGVATEAAWSNADSLTLSNYGSKYDVTLKALYDATYIYTYVKWTDATVNDTRRGWVYNGTNWTNVGGNEDRISFAFTNTSSAMICGHNPTTGTAGELLFDVWHWKASRSAPAGWADDKYWSFDSTQAREDGGRFSDDKTSGGYKDNSVVAQAANATEITAKLGNSTDVSAFSDDDRPYWDNLGQEILWVDGVNSTSVGNSIVGYITTKPVGSRGDVAAEATHDGSAWHVEFKRKLDTGNSADDIVFAEGDTIEFYLNIHDNSGGAGHIIKSGSTTYSLVLESTQASSEPDDSESSESEDSPGFGLIVASSALVLIALIITPRLRRR
ncbi:MAG: ethylbenzene dehydrogenase-related protein [Candidatus Hodarchaeota archaeon]